MSHISPSGPAIAAIRLTIEYSPRQEVVGGQIADVLISKNGLHWIQRKQVCK
jgi:hypothetical protein